MHIQTKVVWNLPIDPATASALETKARELQSQGKLIDSHSHATIDTYTMGRWWIDQPAASEWLDFVVPYGPVSAEIISGVSV